MRTSSSFWAGVVDFVSQSVELVAQEIGGAARDDLFPANGAAAQFFVHRARRGAIVALEIALHFRGNGLVTLVGEDVEHRLGPDDL